MWPSDLGDSLTEVLAFTVPGVHFERLGAANQHWDTSVAQAVEDAWTKALPKDNEHEWYAIHLRWFVCPGVRHRRDLDNLRLKPILDCLTRLGLWRDDDVRHVRVILSQAILVSEPADQHVEVKVYGAGSPHNEHLRSKTLAAQMPSARVQQTASEQGRLDRQALLARGFSGFVTVDDLRRNDFGSVPTDRGIYVVLRESESAPTFLGESPAGRFKGRNPSVPVPQLRSKWVDGVHLLYVGKADQSMGVRGRVQSLVRFGGGDPVPHWGGRYLWQLKDSSQLIVAWRPTRVDESPREAERALCAEFNNIHGRRPFANLVK